MNELISGFVCCDLKTVSTDEGNKYKLAFNPGRLTMALILVSLGAVSKYIW